MNYVEPKKKYKEKNWLSAQYAGKLRSGTSIAKNEGVSYQTIYSWLNRFDIERRDRSLAFHLAKGHRITCSPILYDLLDGLLLGDGHVWSKRHHSGIYQHSSKFRSYLLWLSKFFFQESIDSEPIKKDETQWGIVYRFRTKSYNIFKNFHKRWYKNRIKKLPSDLKLRPVTLREWFIGDGTVKKQGGVTFATHNFTKVEVDQLVKLLNNLDILAYTGRARLDKNWWIIQVPKSELALLYDIMAPLPQEIKDCYGYKWQVKRFQSYRNQRFSEKWLSSEIDFLRNYYGEKKLELMVQKLNRTKTAVYAKSSKLGLTKNINSYH